MAREQLVFSPTLLIGASVPAIALPTLRAPSQILLRAKPVFFRRPGAAPFAGQPVMVCEFRDFLAIQICRHLNVSGRVRWNRRFLALVGCHRLFPAFYLARRLDGHLCSCNRIGFTQGCISSVCHTRFGCNRESITPGDGLVSKAIPHLTRGPGCVVGPICRLCARSFASERIEEHACPRASRAPDGVEHR
jgi:hypothetical protein